MIAFVAGLLVGSVATAVWMVKVLKYNRFGSAWDFTGKRETAYWKAEAEKWQTNAAEWQAAYKRATQ